MLEVDGNQARKMRIYNLGRVALTVLYPELQSTLIR
jgi:hypothetical protein